MLVQKLDECVDLSLSKPLFIGQERLVYQDPRCADWLIKVCRWDNVNKNKKNHRWIKRYSLWRYGLMRSWYKEQEEYLALLWRTRSVPYFIADFYGFCQTSEGPGMVVRKVCDANGDIAKTVAETRFDGVERARLDALVDAFFDELIQAKVVAKDLHMGNVVISGDFERLVLIDGLGDGVLIKTKKYLSYFRNKDLEKKRTRFKQFVASKYDNFGSERLHVHHSPDISQKPRPPVYLK